MIFLEIFQLKILHISYTWLVRVVDKFSTMSVSIKSADEIEKANQEGMERLASVQNEIASNICNSRGLY